MFRFFVALSLSLTFFLNAAPLKVLALTGGGVRGAWTLKVLKIFENKTGLKCHEDFDYFAGTSTGGIIAGLLACGIDIDTILKNYETLSSHVFSHPRLDQLQPKYDSEKLAQDLQKILKTCGISEKIFLNQLSKKVIIPQQFPLAYFSLANENLHS